MDRPVAIEVRDLAKSFQIPGPRAPMTLRGRLRNPTGRTPPRRLDVLQGLSFDVARGEFFGIVGKNGSGKSTLLKLLASVYRADAGSIRIAGRLAPFLELGVGFNPELTALDNVVLNGVMMGLSQGEARRRFGEIIEFAGLGEYTDLQVKNYSSGMKVRLGFAVMTHVDADVLLIDEVLAVGDAEFQEKCGEVFERMHREGRTMILVTHSMQTVIAYCERALLLEDGRIDTIGGPDRVAERYYAVNLKAAMDRPGAALPDIAARIVSAIADPAARITDAWLVDSEGERQHLLERGQRIELRAQIRVEQGFEGLYFHFQISSTDGRTVFASDRAALGEDRFATAAGRGLEVAASVENLLPPGRYTIACDVSRGPEDPAGPRKIVRLEVAGEPWQGTISLEHEISVTENSAEPLVGR